MGAVLSTSEGSASRDIRRQLEAEFGDTDDAILRALLGVSEGDAYEGVVAALLGDEVWVFTINACDVEDDASVEPPVPVPKTPAPSPIQNPTRAPRICSCFCPLSGYSESSMETITRDWQNGEITIFFNVREKDSETPSPSTNKSRYALAEYLRSARGTSQP